MTCTFAQYVALSTMFYYYLVFTRFFVLYPSGCLCKIFSPVVQSADFYYIYGGEVDKNMWKYVTACSYFYHYELHLRKKCSASMEWFFSKANAGLLVVSHHNDQRTLEDIHCDNSQKVCCITSTFCVSRNHQK